MSFNYEDDRIYSSLKDLNIIYYGFRPDDSLAMHELFTHKERYPYQFPSKSTYMLINLSRCSKPSRSFGMATTNSDHIFDSCFESGNLDLVVKIKEGEYDLYMKADSNTKGRYQWFYFLVQCKKAGIVRFNIVNFTKKKSFYTEGMRIAVYSEQKAKRAGNNEFYREWHRAGTNISYGLSKLNQEYRLKAKSK